MSPQALNNAAFQPLLEKYYNLTEMFGKSLEVAWGCGYRWNIPGVIETPPTPKSKPLLPPSIPSAGGCVKVGLKHTTSVSSSQFQPQDVTRPLWSTGVQVHLLETDCVSWFLWCVCVGKGSVIYLQGIRCCLWGALERVCQAC